VSREHDEISRLRAIAFGPGSSDAERRAAAVELEALRTAEVSSPAADDLETEREDLTESDEAAEAAESPEPEPEPEPEPVPEADARHGRRRFVVIGLAVVALVATVATIAIVREQQDSLAIFDRAPTEADVPPNWFSQHLDVAGVRFLGEVEDHQVFGYLGAADPHLDEALEEEQVCLMVTSGQTGGAMCTTREEFDVNGISIEGEVLASTADGEQRRVSFTWGPMGGLQHSIHTLPPRESLEDLLENEPTDLDREGLRHLLDPDQVVAETIRRVVDYQDLGMWLYQPDDDRVCLLVAQRSSFAGDVASDCTTLGAFAESGLTVDWPADGLQLTLGPELRVAVRGLP